jgi:CRISPR-associated protein Cas1
MAGPIGTAGDASTIEELMGAEGWAAKIYFEALGSLLEPSDFSGLRSRPATDPVNAALNFGYALLVGDAKAAAYSAGLYPAVGLLLRDRGRRPAVSLDICEPFRSPVVDSAVVEGFRRRRFRAEEFTVEPDDSVRLGANMRRALCNAYELRMRTEVTLTNEKRSWRGWMHATAHDLAASLRGGRSLPSRRWR